MLVSHGYSVKAYKMKIRIRNTKYQYWRHPYCVMAAEILMTSLASGSAAQPGPCGHPLGPYLARRDQPRRTPEGVPPLPYLIVFPPSIAE